LKPHGRVCKAAADFVILFAAAFENPLMWLSAAFGKPSIIEQLAFKILLSKQELSLRIPAAFRKAGIIT
jgi:hypothetical protein